MENERVHVQVGLVLYKKPNSLPESKLMSPF